MEFSLLFYLREEMQVYKSDVPTGIELPVVSKM